MNRSNLLPGLFGVLFGLAFAGAGLNQYDTLHQMLLLDTIEPYLIMASAIATAMPLLYLLERRRAVSLIGERITLRRSQIERKHITGGIVFGAGWAITGACPGTASTALGAGSIMGIVLIAGMLTGIRLRDVQAERQAGVAPEAVIGVEPVST